MKKKPVIKKEQLFVKCIFENLTLKQAETLANWYSAQGEQQAEVWFDINEVKVPLANGYKVVHGDVVVTCKTVEDDEE